LRCRPADPSSAVGVELISPILTVDRVRHGNWKRLIRHMFKYIKENCNITTNDSCGFHVHMSPGDGKDWTVDEVRRICFAAYYFRDVMPGRDPNNEYATSNFLNNPQFAVHSGPNECEEY
jgi:hypothetical protein